MAGQTTDQYVPTIPVVVDVVQNPLQYLQVDRIAVVVVVVAAGTDHCRNIDFVDDIVVVAAAAAVEKAIVVGCYFDTTHTLTDWGTPHQVHCDHDQLCMRVRFQSGNMKI